MSFKLVKLVKFFKLQALEWDDSVGESSKFKVGEKHGGGRLRLLA